MNTWKLFALITILLMTGVNKVKAQAPDRKIDSFNLQLQADSMLNAFMKKDYKTFIRFTYPKVVTLMGGADKMVTFLEKSQVEMENEGFTFGSVTVGSIRQLVVAG